MGFTMGFTPYYTDSSRVSRLSVVMNESIRGRNMLQTWRNTTVCGTIIAGQNRRDPRNAGTIVIEWRLYVPTGAGATFRHSGGTGTLVLLNENTVRTGRGTGSGNGSLRNFAVE